MAKKVAAAFPDDDQGKRVNKTARERGANTRIAASMVKRKIAKVGGKEFASAGRYTQVNSKGEIVEDSAIQKLRSIQGAVRSGTVSNNPNAGWGMYEAAKTAAGLFNDGGVGYADIADSNNIGYYSYEFPVDALELPASRAEELRFYRLAYDRDPIVGRAIDLHTELPLSKMELSKPKCSSEEYADFVFDEYQRVVQNTKLFQVLIDAVREYWTIGETFIFVEKPADIEPCSEAMKQMDKGQKGDSSDPGKESQFNTPLGGTSSNVIEYLDPSKRSSWARKRGAEIDALKEAGVGFGFDDDISVVASEIKTKRASLNEKTRKYAKMAGVPAKFLAKLVIAADQFGNADLNKAAAEAKEKLAKLIGRQDFLNEPIQQVAGFDKIAQPPGVTDPGAAAPSGGA